MPLPAIEMPVQCTKRDVDSRYFVGRRVLSLRKLIQLIEHFIRIMLLLRLRIARPRQLSLVDCLPTARLRFKLFVAASKSCFAHKPDNMPVRNGEVRVHLYVLRH